MNKKGFTLLELIIALAIGSTIIATVLLSAQGAERANRDTKRRGDANKLSSALEQWADNKSGKYPVWGTDWSGSNGQGGAFFSQGYFKADTVTDPRTNSSYLYSNSAPSCSTPLTPPSTIYYQTHNAGRSWTIDMCLESGTYRLTSPQ